MNLSSDLVSQLVKATKANTKTKSETTLFGTVVYDGRPYVKIDGSELLTPVSTTANVNDGERVTVMIKDHSAIVTGNISSPAARTGDVEEIGSQIAEFEIIIADKVSVKELEAERARIGELVADNVIIRGKLEAAEAEIENLSATYAKIEDLEAVNATIENLDATYATIDRLEADYATIKDLEATNAHIYNLSATYATIEKLSATEAKIDTLEATKLSAKDADLMYANIDFSNISKATMEWFYANSGLIQNVVVGDGTITGDLVGVTIKGDLIEGNTIKADKLVVKGEDGIYYKLNFEAGEFAGGEAVPDDGLHGSVIIANTITAEKINVDDLVAFDATIGGFHITDSSLYSGAKESATNTTRGVYLDSTGQFAVGDGTNFVKYYKDTDGQYKLEISAESIRFGASQKPVDEAVSEYIEDALKDVDIGGRNLIRNSINLIFDNYYFSGTLVASHDNAGNVTISCGATALNDNSGDIIMRTAAKIADDGAGNIVAT